MDSPGRRRRRRRVRPPAAAEAAAAVTAARGVVATGHRLLRVPLAAAYGMASRLEHLPRWSDLWMRADTLEKRAGRWVLRLRGFLAGLPVESVVRAQLEPGQAVRWRQAHGTLLHYAGQFEVEPVEDGVRVRYTVELDPGIAMLDEALVRRVAVQEVERTLDRMKWSAERELVAEEVRLMKVRPAAQEARGEAAEPRAEPVRETAPPASPPEPAGQPPRRRRRKRRRRGGPAPVQPATDGL
ncbi:MAG: SRPBCC family protein [Armatimonadota bacterium]|nr:SRPBCC family protein [Armatimonadota bacterium]